MVPGSLRWPRLKSSSEVNMATVLAPDAALRPVCVHAGLLVWCVPSLQLQRLRSLLFQPGAVSTPPPKQQVADNHQVHCCISPRAAIYHKHSTCIEALPRPRSSQVCTLCQVVVSGRERSGCGGSKLFFFLDHLKAKSVRLLCSESGSVNLPYI